MYLQYKNCAVKFDIVRFKIKFSEKYIIKNGENDILELLDFKLSRGSMLVDPLTSR